jgi:hypothetical protein
MFSNERKIYSREKFIVCHNTTKASGGKTKIDLGGGETKWA